MITSAGFTNIKVRIIRACRFIAMKHVRLTVVFLVCSVADLPAKTEENPNCRESFGTPLRHYLPSGIGGYCYGVC